jgi:FlaA1/EpsC-like NDP-sugar epimerase
VTSILVTGATGFFGNAFVRFLLDETDEERICIYSRDEAKQAKMRAAFRDNDRLRWFVGDVRDLRRLTRAMSGVNTVVHAAALKRIEVGAYAPEEMVQTNVIGSMNVIDAAYEAGVERVIALSSDKAFQPVSPYGQSKALMESLFLTANLSHSGPAYSVVRYGNVWRSTGSVVPTWIDLIFQGAVTVPVTDPNCTRFFMFPEQAVKLVWDTLETMPGEIVIPDWLPAYRLGDLAEAMNVGMQVNGLPAWEKMHEGMRDGVTSDVARRMSVDELFEAL